MRRALASRGHAARLARGLAGSADALTHVDTALLDRSRKLAPPGPVRCPTVLGIETSCDDTGVAIVRSSTASAGGFLEGEVTSDFLASQFDLHATYGGVVPRLAARAHEANLPLGLRHAETSSGLAGGLADVDAVAVTAGPGLAICLRHGFAAAVQLAERLRVPLVKVNHLEAHVLAATLAAPEMRFPFLVLLASGGHTMLVLAKSLGLGGFTVLSTTLDDSLGEAFDKVARAVRVGDHCAADAGLNADDPSRAGAGAGADSGAGAGAGSGATVARTLTMAEAAAAGGECDLRGVVETSKGPPVGPSRDDGETVAGHLGAALERLAADGDADAVPLPVPLRGGGGKHRGRAAFSFAGLKSAVVRVCESPGVDVREREVAAAIAASFQRSAVTHVSDQLRLALAACDAGAVEGGAASLGALVVCGGVAANSSVRAAVAAAAAEFGVPVFAPPPRLCTDNAVMVAWAAARKLHSSEPAALADACWEADFSPRWAPGDRQPVYVPKLRGPLRDQAARREAAAAAVAAAAAEAADDRSAR
ncbi:hypothetical protein FNF29_05740 [Cafeteria roenbergensis]|uniref:N(6)-L-threonylcarbamoyladenine synthase n=1 Tax=Cafeteria roenbergensis TaxID=33653 RepID=A0A5A8CN74_CAFRO|nr:hypothetical protein FNF29_05740 [Cafeteria roenbergensis]KAA0154188.1 hypothetical protein FNF31_06325 [Cafeteria roenbergensis]|eukprot:KAA0149729.1 hypothetical protein FNF29_05740 [Cafeteria roenbergensis]